MVDMTKNTAERKSFTQGDIRGVFIRSNLFGGSWNFERMPGADFCFSMVPAIRRLCRRTTMRVNERLSVTLSFSTPTLTLPLRYWA